MPLDPSIILSVKPPVIQGPNPLETLQAVAQIQGIREQTEARRLAGDAARQKAADDAAVRRVLTETGGDVEKALPQLRMIAPKAALEFETEIASRKEKAGAALKHEIDVRDKQFTFGLGVLNTMTDPAGYDAGRPIITSLSPELGKLLPPTYDATAVARVTQAGLTAKEPHDQRKEGLDRFLKGDAIGGLSRMFSTAQSQEHWDNIIKGAQAVGGADTDALLAQFGPTWSPEAVAHATQLGITPEKREELAGQAATRAQTAAHQAALEAAAQHSPIWKEWQDAKAAGFTGTFDQYQNIDANRRRAITHINTGAATDSDISEMVAGMIDGTLPPQTPGRASPAYTKILAEAHRRGYDLAGAVTDWTATQKHIATMNGAQQLRLNQAVNALPDMLDKVEVLAAKWKGGRFPILNRVNLAAAKGGAYGPQAAGIATQLDAQIADVVADLGNVYMGGNSPTDHALGLAAKSLQADWSEPVLRSMVTLAKENVKIRRNSINSTGVAGASADNPYLPAPPAPPPSPGTPREGEVKPIPGFPGTEQTYRNGRWIRTK